MAGPAWLVLPTYNEADNLGPIVSAARQALASAAPDGYRILIVDDASPDGTGRIADELAALHEEISVLHRPGKGGLGPAYLAGFDAALKGGAGHVLEMDSDFSHDPADLARLLAAAYAGADVVLGSRYVEGGGVTEWHNMRRAISRGGCWYARSMLSLDIQDLTGGFKCFRREVLEAIDLPTVQSRGYAFQVELTYRAVKRGFKVVEVPIVFHERREGASKMSGWIALEAIWRVPQMRFRSG
jgi:dolichol-phosphate mannosyltransferase